MNESWPTDADDFVVVDDDTLSLEFAERALRNTNVKLKCFSNEMNALAYLREHPVRVLVVDNRMPRLDVPEFLRQLVRCVGHEKTHLYLCSAARLPEKIRAAAKELGARVVMKDALRSQSDFLDLMRTDSPIAASNCEGR